MSGVVCVCPRLCVCVCVRVCVAAQGGAAALDRPWLLQLQRLARKVKR